MRLYIKLAYTLLALCTISSYATAQVPKYAFTNYPQPPGQSLGSMHFSADHATAGPKIQCIFYPANFPGMPGGAVKAVYIKVGRNFIGISPYTFNEFRVKMGYTSDSFFAKNPNQITAFISGLPTVYGPASFTATGIDSVGRWVRSR